MTAAVRCPTVTPHLTRTYADGRVEHLHDVRCGGRLRPCPICGRETFCGREGRCISVAAQNTDHWVRRRFNIEDYYGAGVVGWTHGETWNGWQTPHFERAEARALIEAQNAVTPHGVAAWFDDETDAVVIEFEGATDGQERYEGAVIETPEGPKHVYAVGAWAWCWDAMEEDQ